MTNPKSTQLGRFIVRSAGITHQFLAAHEVLELIDAETTVDEILRVHRVFDDGRMDLIGVTVESLHARDGLMFHWNEVKGARQDYDAILACAVANPPPCRIEVQLTHTKDFDEATHVVSLVFPAACGEGVGQWISAAGFQSDAPADASPQHLSRYEAAIAQVILSSTLEPQPVAE